MVIPHVGKISVHLYLSRHDHKLSDGSKCRFFIAIEAGDSVGFNIFLLRKEDLGIEGSCEGVEFRERRAVMLAGASKDLPAHAKAPFPMSRCLKDPKTIHDNYFMKQGISPGAYVINQISNIEEYFFEFIAEYVTRMAKTLKK